jgi:predicted DNA-binding transcriptional regulator AlpA
VLGTTEPQEVGFVGLLTAVEVASKLNVRVKRVYELSIPRVRLSTRSYRWKAQDVERFIDSRTSL